MIVPSLSQRMAAPASAGGEVTVVIGFWGSFEPDFFLFIATNLALNGCAKKEKHVENAVFLKFFCLPVEIMRDEIYSLSQGTEFWPLELAKLET